MKRFQLLFVFFTLFLTSVSISYGSNIVGTWYATRIDGSLDPEGNPLEVTGDVSTWVFNSDGTYSWFLHASPYYYLDDTGTYTYENELIVLNGMVSVLPAKGYIECPINSRSFTFLDDDNDRWIYELDGKSAVNSITIKSDLSFKLPDAIYTSQSGDVNLWAEFIFFGDQGGKLLWELEDVGTTTSAGNPINIASDLSFTIPDATYQSITSDINLKVDFKFFGDQNGKLLWELDSYTLK